MKYLYVVNLNSKRLFTLSVILFVLLGTTLWIGIKIGGMNSLSAAEHKGAIEKEMQRDISLLFSRKKPDEPLKNKKLSENRYSRAVPPLDLKEFSLRNKNKILIKPDPLARRYNNPTKSIVPSSRSAEYYYTVQLGAFVHEKDAKRLLKDIMKKRLNARIDKGIRYYFVRAGKSKNKQKMELLSQKIRNKFTKQEALVLRRKI